MKKLLAIAAAALLLWSCAPKSSSSKGVVLDASMNTVMVVSGSDTLTFSTMNADKSEVDGLFIGDTLEVFYEGDYTPGMEASKVVPAK